MQKRENTELVGEVKEQKRKVKIWKFRASKCYECLKKVTEKIKKVLSRKAKMVKAGINVQVQN